MSPSAPARRLAARRLAALLAVLLAVLAVAAPAAAVDASTQSPVDTSTTLGRSAPTSDALTVQIIGVSPALPQSDPSTQIIAVSALIANNTDQVQKGLYAQLRRAQYPISSENTLTGVIRAPQAIDGGDQRTTPVAVPTIAAHSSVRVTLRANSGSQTERNNIDPLCLCSTGVYPVDVAVGPAGGYGVQSRAWAQFLLPNFHGDQMPVPHGVRVSWVWPLIDRPHRILDTSVFEDGDLGTSVAPGGRLYRALQVAAGAGADSGLTVLVDPDLLDSLQTMSTGYQVRHGKGVVTGTRGQAARDWLNLFRATAARHPVSLTPYGDPDVDAVVRAGLPFSTTPDSQLDATLTQLIGRRPDSQLAWPADGTASARGLDALVAGGATQIVLSDKALPATTSAEDGTPDALSTFTALTGTAKIAVTSTPLEASLRQALGDGPNAVTGRQALIGQLAVRAAQYLNQTRYVVLVPDRYVDVEPTRALSLITTTTRTPWSTGLTVAQAATTVQPVGRDSLVEPSADSSLSTSITSVLDSTLDTVDVVRDTLSSANAGKLLSGYQLAVARGESSWWRTHDGDGLAFAQRLERRASMVRDSVRIVPGTSYALASADAPLYITVDNTLSVPVTVVVNVSPAPSERGFHAGSVRRTIPADSRSQVAVPTRTDRSGRFRVQVALRTAQGAAYGQPLDLRVSSSAVGGIALTITAVAFGILLLALAVRLIRRLRRRSRGTRTGVRSGPAAGGPRPPRDLPVQP